MTLADTISAASVSIGMSTARSHSDESTDNQSSSDGISEYFNSASHDEPRREPEIKVAEFSSLKNAIKLINLEAIKAEEVYKAENLLLSKANEQLMKFSRLLQEQDAELAATEEALSKERKQRESAEKHFIKLKKMMVVKDVEVSEAEQRKKSEVGLRKGAEKEMTMLRRQLQAKESQLVATERKYQKECKKRERCENQMMEISRKAGKQTAEEKYQMLQKLREKTEEEVEVSKSASAASAEPSTKENSFAASNSYEKWKHKETDDTRISSMMEQLSDIKDQLKQTEDDLKRSNVKFNREKGLREEADKQLIVMREKGFAYHIDRRTSARTHAEDCLNTERLKLRNADLQEHYDILKAEAKRTLEKARDRVNEEKAAREAMEEQMNANRKNFDDALERENEVHKTKMEELAKQVKEAQDEISRAKTNYTGSENDLDELRKKNNDFQQQLIEAKAETKKEQTLRVALQAEMKAMDDELDQMENDLKVTKEALQKAEEQLEAHKEKAARITAAEEKLEKVERLYQQEVNLRTDNEKTMEVLKAEAEEAKNSLEEATQKTKTLDEDNLVLTEAKEKIKFLEEELQETESRYKHLRERHQRDLESQDRSKEDKLESQEKNLQSAEARCKLLKDKLQKEQEMKEKSEEATFKLTLSLKQLTVELEQAKSNNVIAEKQILELKETMESMTCSFQHAMSQGGNSENKRDQMIAIRQDLEQSKEKCLSLRESLEHVERQYRQERDLRLAAEASLTMDERSLARKHREETEQEVINMEANYQALRLTEDQWREEKQQREHLEEQCRSLRDEIYRLKHEQVMSSPPDGGDTGRDDRVEKLKEELELAESRRRVINESLEEERKRRWELEQQNLAFRDMIPEYAEAEERYQKERRLRSEAESTIESLRSKLMSNKKFWSDSKDESTLTSANMEGGQQQVVELQMELETVRSECEKAKAALHVAHERYEKEHHMREQVESELQSSRSGVRGSPFRSGSPGSPDVERKLREQAAKQVMSMRLKMEAKETEIATLKSRLSETRSASTVASKASSRERQRQRRPGTDTCLSPLPPSGRQLEYRPSPLLSMITYDEPQPQQIQSKDENHVREEIMTTLPEYVTNTFGRIGFVKHSSFDYWPALVLDPFEVPLAIRTKWLELYYEFDKRDMFLVYLYGRRHRENVNAYPIIEPHHFIAYEEGVERNLDQLPAVIEDKLRYGDRLDDLEEELSDGLTQIRIDARQHPKHRTHPLAERHTSQRGTGAPATPSVTSSTSGTSSHSDGSTKRPRSEYSLPPMPKSSQSQSLQSQGQEG